MRPIFLALLALVALAFATVPAAAQSYRIKPGDTLVVNVLEDPTLDREVLVLPDGSISLPLAGTVRAGGLTVGEVQGRIAAELEPNFAARPNVFVAVGTLAEVLEVDPATISVYVVGEVNAPGILELEPGTNMLQAIAAAGGPSRFAATRRFQLRRVDHTTGQDRVGTFNYQAVLNGTSLSGLVPLRDGDVIVVPERRLFE